MEAPDWRGRGSSDNDVDGERPTQSQTGSHTMKPRITLITLGVDDLERAVTFYRDGLGLPTKGIVGTEFEHGAVAFFDLQSGLQLAVWPRSDLAHDTGLPRTPPSATELSIGHNVGSRAEVES